MCVYECHCLQGIILGLLDISPLAEESGLLGEKCSSLNPPPGLECTGLCVSVNEITSVSRVCLTCTQVRRQIRFSISIVYTYVFDSHQGRVFSVCKSTFSF